MTEWDAITDEAAADSPLWATMVLPLEQQEREPVFSLLAEARVAAALETIYEAYLIHLGCSRLFAAPDADTALLLGDYLYARGLARAQALVGLRLMADFAELISIVGETSADGCEDDGLLWAATAVAAGHPDLPAAREVFARTADTAALAALVLREADRRTVDHVLEAHRARLGGASLVGASAPSS